MISLSKYNNIFIKLHYVESRVFDSNISAWKSINQNSP